MISCDMISQHTRHNDFHCFARAYISVMPISLNIRVEPDRMTEMSNFFILESIEMRIHFAMIVIFFIINITKIKANEGHYLLKVIFYSYAVRLQIIRERFDDKRQNKPDAAEAPAAHQIT